MTRNGKIARIPRDIREQVNIRLYNGVPGKDIVAWLNSMEEVKFVLHDYFQSRPVTEQNLSEWKQGGYQDWLSHQHALEGARTLFEQAEEIHEETEGLPLSDSLAATVALALGRILHQTLAKGIDTPEQRQELLSLSRELAALRADDHRAARLRMDHADWELRWEEAQERRTKAKRHDEEWEMVNLLQVIFRRKRGHGKLG